MASRPSVTVAVCSYNGAQRIGRTIDSLLCQTLAPEELEILVIDNASNDNTAEVARSYGPRVRVVSEPRPGLSAARNRALTEASGDVVAFIDDDAEGHQTWIESLLKPFADASVGGAGGPVELIWPGGAVPRWFHQEIAGFFSGLKRGDAVEDLQAPDWPYGTNMAVRRDAAIDLGGYREDLGRIGTSLLSYEEYDFFDRMARTGAAIRYEPTAWVDHHVDPGRVSVRWLFKRAWVNGQSHVVWEGQRPISAHARRLLGALVRVGALVGRGLVRLRHRGSGVAFLTADLSRASHWSGMATASAKAILFSPRARRPSPVDA